MPCYHPKQGWRSLKVNPSGKRSIIFGKNNVLANRSDPIYVPCGQCIGCRLEYSRQWAIRLVHEASLYENNCFITLTYNNETIPDDWSLNKKDYQDFMKALRHAIYPKRIRFFHCGEYGEKTYRPHYHAVIFNHDFNDKVYWSNTNAGPLYVSPTLSKLWNKGQHRIGAVTFESAAYVARYVTKKINGDNAINAYTRIDEETGEVLVVQPEYATMSRRPGIASTWYNKFKTDVFPKDFITIRGKKMFAPKYYTKALELENPKLHRTIKEKRLAHAEDQAKNNTPDRLGVRETCKKAQISQLRRRVE